MTARPNAPHVKYLVTGGRWMKVTMSTFDTADAAEAYRVSCSHWYGVNHPLFPFAVDTVEHNAPLFPFPSDMEW